MPVRARELFNTKFSTLELMTSAELLQQKQEIKALAEAPGRKVAFYEEEGVHYYTHTFEEDGQELTTINAIKPVPMVSRVDYWKFGFISPEGVLYLFQKGDFLAKGRKAAFAVYKKIKALCEVHKLGQPFARKS